MSSESLRARLAAATPGPWITVSSTDGVTQHYWVQAEERNPVDQLVVESHDGVPIRPDANLIAHAPTDLAAALKVIELAKAEHTMGAPDGDGCRFCSCGISDCPTAFEVEAFEALP